MTIVQAPFDINVDFWKNNFLISLIEPFDKIKKKKDSSKIMWCIWMMKDPNPINPVVKIPEKDRVSAIKRYYPKYKENDKDIIAGLKAYPKTLLSNAAKAFVEEEDLMSDRAEMMKSMSDHCKAQIKKNTENLMNLEEGQEYVSIIETKGFQDTLKVLDTMRKNTKSIYDSYTKISKDFQLEVSKVQIEGGGSEGLLEKGGLPELNDDD